MTAETAPDEIEASRAPLLDHLTELRNRLWVACLAVFVCFLIAFVFSKQIFLFLSEPFLTALSAVRGPEAAKKGIELVNTGAMGFFTVQVKVALFAGIMAAFPVIAYQAYAFVAPGLYKRERRAFIPFLVASPILFVMGAALVYYIMLPFVMWFSLSQQITAPGVSVELLPKVSEYLSLVTTLLLAFGLCFQLPVVLSLLGLSGMVSSKQLAAGRRFAIVGIAIVAAIVTPPDPISMLMLCVPIVLLYEVSIWCVRLIELRRPQDDNAAPEGAL